MSGTSSTRQIDLTGTTNPATPGGSASAPIDLPDELPTPPNTSKRGTTAGEDLLRPPTVHPPGKGANDALGPLPLTRPVADLADYKLRMGSGWTVNDGTFDHVPPQKRRKRDVPYPSYVNHTYRSMNGLSTLQLSHEAPINLCAMDIACDHVWKCLPQEVRTVLLITPPNGPGLWSQDVKARDRVYEKMKLVPFLDSTKQWYRLYPDLKNRPWVIWPIWVEDDWGKDYVTFFWYAEASPNNPEVFDRIAAYTIIDPRRARDVGVDGKHHPVHDRLERLKECLVRFLDNGGFEIDREKHYVQTLSSPMPIGQSTSGERCFAAVKELCVRVCNWTTSGKTDHKPIFDNMAPWVNPYQFRVEMTGINAWVLMATFDYNARISVECIVPNLRTEVVADGKKKLVNPYDLAGPYNEPPIASPDYLLPTPSSALYGGGSSGGASQTTSRSKPITASGANNLFGLLNTLQSSLSAQLSSKGSGANMGNT